MQNTEGVLKIRLAHLVVVAYARSTEGWRLIPCMVNGKVMARAIKQSKSEKRRADS